MAPFKILLALSFVGIVFACVSDFYPENYIL